MKKLRTRKMRLTPRSSCCGRRVLLCADNSRTYICSRCGKVCEKSLGLSSQLMEELKRDLAKVLDKSVFIETPFTKQLKITKKGKQVVWKTEEFDRSIKIV